MLKDLFKREVIVVTEDYVYVGDEDQIYYLKKDNGSFFLAPSEVITATQDGNTFTFSDVPAGQYKLYQQNIQLGPSSRDTFIQNVLVE